MDVEFQNFPRIIATADTCSGKPRIKDTRIPVSSVLAHLAGGMTIDEFLTEFHWISREDVLQALAFSAQMMSEFHYFPLKQAS